jgi:hypothetical protein
MTFGSPSQMRDRVQKCGLRLVAAAALLCAILSLNAVSPAEAQAAPPAAPASTDAHPALTPAEAQRALDALQDAGKRDQLIETLRSIAKVSAPSLTPAAPAAVNPATATDGFGAGLLSEASRRLGEMSAEFAHGARTVTKFPLLWRWLNKTASDPVAQQLLLGLLWRAAAVAALALLAERLVQFALRRPLAALDARATHEAGPAGPVEPGADMAAALHVRRLTWLRRAVGRAPLVVARLILELAPIAAFAIVGNSLLAPASAKIPSRASRSWLWSTLTSSAAPR